MALFDGFGDPSVKTFKKRYTRHVKVHGSSTIVHIKLEHVVCEMLVSAHNQGIHLPEEIGGWIPYVDGQSAGEYGLVLLLEDFPAELSLPWLFKDDGGALVFAGSYKDADDLNALAESQRMIRATPKSAEGRWKSTQPGFREVTLDDCGDDVAFFQLVFDTAAQDGIFDEGCAELAGYIQKRYGVPITKTLDENTWQAILPTSRNFRIGYGSNGHVVRVLQAMLVAYDWAGELQVTGRFDLPTMGAVKHVQEVYGLRPTGIMEAPTWAALLGRGVRNV
jgi:peptidoglycan hydrolase-like protein with peptidoglycan-binding domain